MQSKKSPMATEELVSRIDRVFESININASIVVCPTSYEVDFLTQILKEKSYPYVSYGSPQIEEYCNKMIVTTIDEFNKDQLWAWLGETTIDCVFFQNGHVFHDCIETAVGVLQQDRCFIFTMS